MPAKHKPGKAESNRASIFLFGGGIALILSAALAPLLTWISIAVKQGVGEDKKHLATISIRGMGGAGPKAEAVHDTKTDHLFALSRPEGGLIMGLGFLVAVLLTVGFALFGVLEGKLAEQVLNSTLLVGLGWGICLVVWGLAWLLKTIALSHEMQKGLAEAQSRIEVKSGTRSMEFTFQPFPGPGLILILLAALLLAYILSRIASHLNKQRQQLFRAEQLKGVSRQAVERLYMGRKELLVAEGAGVLLGVLILLFVVQPWNADALWIRIKPLALDLPRGTLMPNP